MSEELPGVGEGDKTTKVGFECFVVAEDTLYILVWGVRFEEESDKGVSIARGTSAKCALPVGGRHLQEILNQIRKAAEEMGITVI